jgi:hypothetical protein
MNAAHAHLILNHLPILALPLGVALFGWAWWKGQLPTARLALMGLIAASLAVIPVFLSGEPAEEAVEHLAGVGEGLIHAHEEAAELSMALSLALGALALATLLVRQETAQRWLRLGILGLGLAASASLAWTGNLGGKIRHTEIRGGVALPGAEQGREADHAEMGGSRGEKDDDD